LLSWTCIIQRAIFLKKAREALLSFEDEFWSGINLAKLYSDINAQEKRPQGIKQMFVEGFREFIRLRKQNTEQTTFVMDGVQRAMRIAQAREIEKLENHLPFLASVGSTSPYIGLFGTVWGIMMSLQALGSVQQATIAMVAPGISEALIATAMGLFAAIPAVLAYNRYSAQVERLIAQYDIFQEELSNILQHQTTA